MSAKAWTLRRAKRDMRRLIRTGDPMTSRHVLRLRVSQIARLGWTVVLTYPDGEEVWL